MRGDPLRLTFGGVRTGGGDLAEGLSATGDIFGLPPGDGDFSLAFSLPLFVLESWREGFTEVIHVTSWSFIIINIV